MVLSIYRELVHRHPEVKGTPTVAVISPYKAQVRLYCIPHTWKLHRQSGHGGKDCPLPTAQVALLRETFGRALGPDLSKMVDINTIDGFQVRWV